jgi:hypothetical protein
MTAPSNTLSIHTTPPTFAPRPIVNITKEIWYWVGSYLGAKDLLSLDLTEKFIHQCYLGKLQLAPLLMSSIGFISQAEIRTCGQELRRRPEECLEFLQEMSDILLRSAYLRLPRGFNRTIIRIIPWGNHLPRSREEVLLPNFWHDRRNNYHVSEAHRCHQIYRIPRMLYRHYRKRCLTALALIF